MYMTKAYIQCSLGNKSPVIGLFVFNEYINVYPQSIQKSLDLLFISGTYGPCVIQGHSAALFVFVALLFDLVVGIALVKGGIVDILFRFKAESVHDTVVHNIICRRKYLRTETGTVERYNCCSYLLLCMVNNAFYIISDNSGGAGIADEYSCGAEASVGFDYGIVKLFISATDNVSLCQICTQPSCTFHLHAACSTVLLYAEINTMGL